MYAPITWQVDRTCHLISAASFDEMCRYMKNNADDMTSDLHPHGARELVAPEWASDTIYRKSDSSCEPVPPTPTPTVDPNPCAGTKPYDAQFTHSNGTLDASRTIVGYFNNRNCSEMMDTGFAINLPHRRQRGV